MPGPGSLHSSTQGTHVSAELNAISDKAVRHLVHNPTAFAFEAGYQLAGFIRSLMPPRGKFVDIGDVLYNLGVSVEELDLVSDRIDAIAIWGDRGPSVLLNSARAYKHDPNRTRMTLSHELCHVLIDRQGGLPFCEVMGGKVDLFIEQRASAFAAEFLLPRSVVHDEWGQWQGKALEFIWMLCQEYGVSKRVAYAQVHNSAVFDGLNRETQDRVKYRLRHQQSQEMILRAMPDVV